MADSFSIAAANQGREHFHFFYEGWSAAALQKKLGG